MERIENKINELLALYLGNRSSGSTTILKEVAKNNEVAIIVLNEQTAKEFGDKAVSINTAFKKLMGITKRPIFLDNGTMIELLSNVNNEFRYQKEAIDGLKQTILNQNNDIQNIEKHRDRLSARIIEYSKKNWFQRMLKNI